MASPVSPNKNSLVLLPKEFVVNHDAQLVTPLIDFHLSLFRITNVIGNKGWQKALPTRR
jgi:hypothetical protein